MPDASALFDQYGLSPAARAFATREHGHWIAGAWQAAARHLQTEDPASATVFGRIAQGDADTVNQAVNAARAALDDAAWSDLPPAGRQKLLLDLADAIAADAALLAELESLDNGKPLRESQDDIAASLDYLRHMAGMATQLDGRAPRLGAPDTLAYTRREPVGVVAAIVPWNFPFSMALWKITPCLATGCTVVLKPAEQTSLTALRLAELSAQVGCPPGVVNVVTGTGAAVGQPLVEHPGVDKIAFTGSTAVGQHIAQVAARRTARITLELGGKSPMLVFDDADLPQAIPGLANAIFYNQGQVCTAGSRLYVQRGVYERVIEGVAQAASARVLGHGFDADSTLGPLISARQKEQVSQHIRSAIAAGARCLTPRTLVGLAAASLAGTGHFVPPTVLADVQPDMACVREEIFGPVLVCAPFDTEEEALALANDSRYGLAASVWTRSLDTAHRVSARLQAGTVWVNNHWLIDPSMPFGGMKQSGLGRELGPDQLEAYLETKSVIVQL